MILVCIPLTSIFLIAGTADRVHQGSLMKRPEPAYLFEVSWVFSLVQVAAEYGYDLRVCVSAEHPTMVHLRHTARVSQHYEPLKA